MRNPAKPGASPCPSALYVKGIHVSIPGLRFVKIPSAPSSLRQNSEQAIHECEGASTELSHCNSLLYSHNALRGGKRCLILTCNLSRGAYKGDAFQGSNNLSTFLCPSSSGPAQHQPPPHPSHPGKFFCLSYPSFQHYSAHPAARL